MINQPATLFSLGLPEKQSSTPKLQTMSPSMASPLSNSTKECPDVKIPNFSTFGQTLHTSQSSYVKPQNPDISSKPMLTNSPTQAYVSSPFPLSQAVPQRHVHPPCSSVSQQRLPQPDFIQGGTQLMFPGHFQDGRGTLRFRYLNLLARLFPQFSDIFINSVLEDTNCDLLAAAEWLVQLEDRRSFMYPGFETFGTIPYGNQYFDNPDGTHQKVMMESQQIDSRPSFRFTPPNAYMKLNRENKMASDVQQSQARLSCSSQACFGSNQLSSTYLHTPSQPFQNKTGNVSKVSNGLPNSQVRIFIFSLYYILYAN